MMNSTQLENFATCTYCKSTQPIGEASTTYCKGCLDVFLKNTDRLSHCLVDCRRCFSKQPLCTANTNQCIGCESMYNQELQEMGMKLAKNLKQYIIDTEENDTEEKNPDENDSTFFCEYTHREPRFDEYVIDGILYSGRFPLLLAGKHPGAGPKDCQNCHVYGCIDTVFIGFCLNCITYFDGVQGVPCAPYS